MSNLKILIVEDKRMVAEDIKESLEEMDYEVVDIVSTGENALESYKEKQPEFLLMDINLKGALDGIDTMKEIYKIKPVPFIYLTAYSNKSIVERALQTHPSSYLIKPFDNRELEIAIELAIANFSDKKHAQELIAKQDYIDEEFLFFKIGKAIKKVELNSILYAKANGSYTDLFTADNHYTLSINLQHLLEKSTKLHLVRVHRSYAVNINQLNGYAHQKLTIGEIEIPVGRTFRPLIKALIDTV